MNNQSKKLKKKIFFIRKSFREKILEVVRVTRVSKGGKQIGFRSAVVVGNKKGMIGIGVGKASDFGYSIRKAIINAKKNICKIFFSEKFSIPYTILEKYGAAKVMLSPAKQGTGILAGGAPKVVLEMAGVSNAIGKQFGSSNIINNARATLNALKRLNNNVLDFGLLKKKKEKYFLKIRMSKIRKRFKKRFKRLKYIRN